MSHSDRADVTQQVGVERAVKPDARRARPPSPRPQARANRATEARRRNGMCDAGSTAPPERLPKTAYLDIPEPDTEQADAPGVVICPVSPGPLITGE